MGNWYLEQPVEERGPIGAYCFWWAMYTVIVLKEHGIPCCIHAGTAYWPRLRSDQDDGLPTTMPQFGYKYNQKTDNLIKLILGTLPEMHIWVCIVDRFDQLDIIIDLTTKYWPERAMSIGGYDWPGDKPPEYYWGSTDELPDGACYIADMEAVQLLGVLINILNQ